MTSSTTSLFSVTSNFLCSLPVGVVAALGVLDPCWAKSLPFFDKLTMSSVAAVEYHSSESELEAVDLGIIAVGLTTLFIAVSYTHMNLPTKA